MTINNTYIIPTECSIICDQKYGGSNQGFIFSFEAFSTTPNISGSNSNNAICSIYNNSGINYNIYLQDYTISYSINGATSILAGNYNVGDIIPLIIPPVPST